MNLNSSTSEATYVDYRCKGTVISGSFQIFRPDLLGVVATEWDGCDKGGLRVKILSHEQRKWGSAEPLVNLKSNAIMKHNII